MSVRNRKSSWAVSDCPTAFSVSNQPKTSFEKIPITVFFSVLVEAGMQSLPVVFIMMHF